MEPKSSGFTRSPDLRVREAHVLSTGIIQDIYISEFEGHPMVRMRSVVVNSQGIVGDRYCKGNGHWSSFPDQTGSALTLIASEVIESSSFEGPLLRRNIVTSGLDLGELIGREFSIGLIRCFGVRPCLPCKYLEDIIGRGFRKEHDGIRGGLRVDVLKGGLVAIGDPIELIG